MTRGYVSFSLWSDPLSRCGFQWFLDGESAEFVQQQHNMSPGLISFCGKQTTDMAAHAQ
jgi:hypothetical protein